MSYSSPLPLHRLFGVGRLCPKSLLDPTFHLFRSRTSSPSYRLFFALPTTLVFNNRSRPRFRIFSLLMTKPSKSIHSHFLHDRRATPMLLLTYSFLKLFLFVNVHCDVNITVIIICLCFFFFLL